jgi:cyclic pyranopterin phosphate synthase
MPEEGVSLTPGNELLTSAEIVKIAGLFVDAGVDKIRFTGGEPTVRADILDIMAEVNTLRPRGLKTIGMTTNGIVLARKMADYRAAGLNSVNISLDTLDPNLFQIITRRNGHDKVLASIEAALSMMPPGSVKVNCVVMRGVNDQELVDFVRWTEKKDVEVRFIEFMPFDGNKFSRQKFFSFLEMKERIRAALPIQVLPAPGHSDVAKVYQVPGFLGRVGFISSMSEHFCDSCNRLRITADGNLKVCLFGPTEVSLRDILRENQTDDQIREVIGMAVSRKKAKHAGMDNLAKMKNRPMITIGG